MPKTCTVCRETKDEEDFPIHSGTKRRTNCKVCHARKSNDRYREKNPVRKVFHRITNFEPSTSSGICSVCGPVAVKISLDKRNGHDILNCKNKIAELNRKSALRAYGLTIEDYDHMLTEQGGVCAICGDPPGQRSLHVDHNHATGQVRSLLCNPCNVAIGHAKECPDRLTKMIEYLAGH